VVSHQRPRQASSTLASSDDAEAEVEVWTRGGVGVYEGRAEREMMGFVSPRDDIDRGPFKAPVPHRIGGVRSAARGDPTVLVH
jgi:hypothetical protein